MTGEIREKDKGVPTDNGGRFAAHSRTAADITLTPQFTADEETEIEAEHDQWARETQKPTYTLDPHHVRFAQKAVDDANKRLARYGIDERFEATYTDGVVRDTGPGGIPIEKPVVYMQLDRPRVSFEGWSFTGVHDVTSDGQMIHFTSSDLPVPDVTDTTCDFCGKSRRRERVFTLHSDTDGDKQVGKSCLEAFIGVKPKGLWALEWTLDPDELMDEADRFYQTRKNVDVFERKEMLAVAAAMTNNGETFVPKSRASMQDPATADLLISKWDEVAHLATDEHRAFADEVLTWLEEQPAGNDYLDNVKASLLTKDETKWVAKRHVGIAASVLSAYRRDKDRAAEQAAKEKARVEYTPGFLAEEKTKIADISATITRISHTSSTVAYGIEAPKTIVSMISADGHQVTWFASGSKNFTVGQEVKIAGTVKNHDTYQGNDQTVITRAKLTHPDTGEKLGDYDDN